MADILIRGMRKPKTCSECYDAGLPTAIAFLGTKCPRETGCPIHELPEHGDLIEKQAALAALYSDYAYVAMDIIEKKALVLIPSNKEDAE